MKYCKFGVGVTLWVRNSQGHACTGVVAHWPQLFYFAQFKQNNVFSITHASPPTHLYPYETENIQCIKHTEQTFGEHRSSKMAVDLIDVFPPPQSYLWCSNCFEWYSNQWPTPSFVFNYQPYHICINYAKWGQCFKGYCTPGQFLDFFCIFLKNYNTLVTSKMCFL